jgi:hypothetical protein
LTVPQYQRTLTNVENVLRPYVVRLMNSKSLAEFDAKRAQLEGAVRLQRQVLAKLMPPRTFLRGPGPPGHHNRAAAAAFTRKSRAHGRL